MLRSQGEQHDLTIGTAHAPSPWTLPTTSLPNAEAGLEKDEQPLRSQVNKWGPGRGCKPMSEPARGGCACQRALQGNSDHVIGADLRASCLWEEKRVADSPLPSPPPPPGVLVQTWKEPQASLEPSLTPSSGGMAWASSALVSPASTSPPTPASLRSGSLQTWCGHAVSRALRTESRLRGISLRAFRAGSTITLQPRPAERALKTERASLTKYSLCLRPLFLCVSCFLCLELYPSPRAP